MTSIRLSAMAMLMGATFGCLMSSPVKGRVLKLDIEEVKAAPKLPGAPEFEIVSGRFYGEVDPTSPNNSIITDLEFAPRNARGLVEYSASFAIARPRDPARRSGVLFYDVPNRGNGAVAPNKYGHVQVISGWQGDISDNLGLQTLSAPIARRRNGRPLTGPVMARFVDLPRGLASAPIVGSLGRPTAMPQPLSLDTRRARLTVQDRPGVAPRLIPSSQWAFADCALRPFPGVPDPAKLCVKGGFAAGRAYSLVYTARDPRVMGLGFAATRDLVAFLRTARADDMGTENPAGSIRWAVASGTSQSGNFLKSFVNLGFNADEAGRIVFDGINPNIAARQVPLNIRFAVTPRW